VVSKLIRIRTHIEGFDELVGGGFPLGSNILVTGSPGTGKTIFSLQYIVEGALNDDGLGVYFTFEERRSALVTQAAQFGWDLDELEKKKKLKIISIGIDDIGKNTITDLIEIVTSLRAKRVVIDSLTTLTFLRSEGDVTVVSASKFLHSFMTGFKKLDDVTSLFLSSSNSVSSSVAEYVCDGIVDLNSENFGGNYSKNLHIKKMRSTKNNEDLHPFEIKDKTGIIVHNF